MVDRPVVGFGSAPGYGPVFNAGVMFHEGRFHLFARGVREGYRRNPGAGPRFLDYVSDVLVFTSLDGCSYEFQQVLAQGSPGGVWAYEDPRVQRVGAAGGGQMVMTYTSLCAPETGRPYQVGVQRLGYADGRFFLNHSSGRAIGPDGVPDKDAVVFGLDDGRVALIHRVYPNMQLAVFDSLEQLWDPPEGYWDAHLNELERHTLIRPAGSALCVGAGAPPVWTPEGLVLLYHEREEGGEYTMRASLLDPLTGWVQSLLPGPVMWPEREWERDGDVDNVVFVQGAVPRPDGTIYLTYGAADRHVGAACLSTDELLAAFRAAAPTGSPRRPPPAARGRSRRSARASRCPEWHGSVRARPGRS